MKGVLRLAIDAAFVAGGIGVATYGAINSVRDAKAIGRHIKSRDEAPAPIETKEESPANE